MNNEAPFVAFTNYKRLDGFEISLTLRGDNLEKVITGIDRAIKGIIAKGGTPVSRQRFGGASKPVEYVVDRVCPKDGGRLIKPPVGTNRPIKCENGKYDFATKVSSGCDFKEWPKPVVQVNTNRDGGIRRDEIRVEDIEIPDDVDF